MPMRSILVHMAADADHMHRLAIGYELAAKLEAHLTILHTAKSVHTPIAVKGRGASLAFNEEARQLNRERVRKIKAEFNSWLETHPLPSHRWVTSHDEPLPALVAASHTHDLVIISQSEPHNLEEMLFAQLPDHLGHVGSCPVLMLPHGEPDKDFGKRILIAWKPAREAAHAMRDSLSFLRRAEQVFLLSVERGKEAAQHLDEAEFYLKRHEIRVQKQKVERGHATAGELILAQAKTLDADMIVAGGLSERRLGRELVLGRTTRRIITETHLPVLMSR